MAVELPITDDFEEGCLARSQDVLEALGLTDDEPPEEAPALLEPPAPAAMKSEAASVVEANSPTLRLRDRRSIKKPAHAEFDDDSPRRSSPKASRSGGTGSPLSKHGLASFGGRKLYLCRWCGLPKKNHVCEGAVDALVLASRQRAARSANANGSRIDSSGSSSSSLSTMAAEEDTSADSIHNESDDADPVAISTRGTGRTRARQQQRSAPVSTGMIIDTDCSDLFDVSPSGITAIGSRIEGAFMCDSGAMQWYASLPDERVRSGDSVSQWDRCPDVPPRCDQCLNAPQCRFGGVISEFSQTTGEHLVIYDDGEQKWHDLDEGVATKVLRWPGGSNLWGAGEDEGPVTPKAPPVPVERVESVSPRKRRAPEPVQTDGTPALVCDYCSSRGKVHRKCLRLESCPIIWKRNGKSKARRDAEEGNRSPATPGTPELIRSGRAPALPPAKRAQVLSARTPDSSPVPHSPAVDADEWQYAPTPSSELWPFPVIVPPEALGWNLSKEGTIMHSNGPLTDESVAELL